MFNNSIEKKRVAIYCRVSTDEQVQNWNWLDIQKQALLNYIKANSFQYELSDNNIYIEEWKSWANKEEKDRPELYKMFKWAENWEFDIVLVWKIDRFFRKTLYLLEWIEALESLWVWFISTTQPFDTTQPFWKMMLQMMWVIAELERELIKERTHSWILASMNKWKWWRWQCPYWFRKNKDWYLEVDLEENKIIKFINKLLINEESSVDSIAKKLNNIWINTQWTNGELWDWRKENIKHRNFWHRWVIHKILTNEIYTWKLIQNRFTTDKKTKKRKEKPKKEWIISECPRIVSNLIFKKAQLQLQKNTKFSKRNKKENTVYMLWGLMVEKETWYAYSGYKSSKWTKNYRVLIWKTKSKEKVNQYWISWNKIESVVWEKVKNVLLRPELLEIELAKLSKLNDEWIIDNEILLIKSNIKTLELKNKNIINFSEWLSIQDVEMVKETINENRIKINTYKSQIEELESKKLSDTEKKQQLKDLKKLSTKLRWLIINDEISYEAKTIICRNLIDKIIIDNEDVEITMIVPDTRKRKKWEFKQEVIENMFNNKSDFIKKWITYNTNNASLSKESVELCHYIGGVYRTQSESNSF